MKTKRLSIGRVAVLVCMALALHVVPDWPIVASMQSADANAQGAAAAPTVTLLTSGLEGPLGSTLGPGGALYVTESAAGTISRVDPQTGEVTVVASGLPPMIPAVGLGGAIDVAFLGTTAYVLVTLVGPDVGGQDVVGIYRVDGPDTVTPIADIGAFALQHPPETDFVVPTGVQFALDAYRGGFLVTDGHHNRVLHVTLRNSSGTEQGRVRELMAFDNIVPTGLAVSGTTVYMAEAGPVPHRRKDGKIVAFEPGSSSVREVAVGAKLLVDVEFGYGRTLFGLSQGDFPAGAPAGAPALPHTGALLQVNENGKFVTVIDAVNQPTSLELIGNTAYIVTLSGEVWRVDGLSGPPYGVSR
jgi:DNA-binding beta-propeller fold protein YncE